MSGKVEVHRHGSKYCERCGRKTRYELSRTTFDPEDGHTILWYDSACPRSLASTWFATCFGTY